MNPPTDFSKLDALYPLPADEIFRQWVLSRDAGTHPSGWNRRSFGDWHLSAHPDALICDLEAADGSSLGCVIDALLYLTDSSGLIPKNRLRLPIAADSTAEQVQRALYGRDEEGRSTGNGLEGPWTALVFGGSGSDAFERVYTGPTHSIMYHPERRVVATSHNLMPSIQRNEALSGIVDPLVTNSYYTFGLTAFLGIRRLLPNHYLDLATLAPVRHWPASDLEPRLRQEAAAAAIVPHAHRVLEVLATEWHHFRVYLSAGRDSRAVLGLLRPLVEERDIVVDAATSFGSDLGSRTDLQAARRLARIARVPHITRRRQPLDVTSEEIMRAFVRIGEARAGKRLGAGTTEEPKPEAPRFDLGGMAGEIARSVYWTPTLRHETLTPDLLLRQMRLPASHEVLRAAGAWLDGLPAGVRASAADILDLAYIEQRMGCWEFASRYLFHGPLQSTSLMATSFAMETMLRLEPADRAAGTFQRSMVAYAWPELLEVPFNEPWGLLRLRDRLTRRARRVLRKLPVSLARTGRP